MKMMNRSSSHTSLLAAVLGVACLGAWVIADDVTPPPQPDRPAQQDEPGGRRRPPGSRPGEAQAIRLEGTVQNYNLAPMGEVESLNLTTSDGMVQLIMPPAVAEKVAALAPEGSQVQVTAMAEPPRPPRGQGGPRRGGPEGGQGQDGGGAADNGPRGGNRQAGQGGQDALPARNADADTEKPDHKVYRLVSITAAGKTIELAGKPSEAHVEGTIKHLNYDRSGQVDGVILDTGVLVGFAPAANATLKLQPGQKLTADGMSRQLPNGQTILTAETVNGTTVPQQQRGGPRQRGPGEGGGDRNGPPGGGGGPDGGPGPGGQ